MILLKQQKERKRKLSNQDIKELLAKEIYNFGDLVKIMELLRSDGGCPWDREQTHSSIRNNFIEEVYEAIDGIDNSDDEILKEELGDVLLQVVFHARIAEEENSFDINGVADGICKKLILRHPHIFSDVEASTSAEVLKNWDEIKKIEKHQKTSADTLRAVSASLPALARASKLQSKAAKVGFTYADAKEAMEKVREEYNETVQALESGDAAACEEEFGDLLFAVANAARLAGVNPEEALYRANEKFIGRYSEMERMINAENKQICELNVNKLLEFWEKTKNN